MRGKKMIAYCTEYNYTIFKNDKVLAQIFL